MSILFGLGSDRADGPDILFDCTSCGAKSVAAATWTHQDQFKVLLIPVFRKTTTFLRCGRCRRRYTSSLTVAELFVRGPDLSAAAKLYSSPPATAMAMSSLLLSWFPILGFLVAMVAYYVNREVRGWRRTISFVSLILSGLASLWMLFALLLR